MWTEGVGELTYPHEAQPKCRASKICASSLLGDAFFLARSRIRAEYSWYNMV